MPYYHVNNDLNKAQGINNNLDRFVIDHLCEPINNDEDWVIVVSFSVRSD